MKSIIWLGALHYGSFIRYDLACIFLEELIKNNFDIHIDLSDLYASGNAIEFVGKLCKDYPNIKVSIKYGLEKKIKRDGTWGVEVSNGDRKAIRKSIENYLKFIPEKNIYSFQFHAFNQDKIESWFNELIKFDFLREFGVSNMSTEEAIYVDNIAKTLSKKITIGQIHANLLERKILNEYKENLKIKEIITNRSLARGFLSNRNVNGKQEVDSRTRNSQRVKDSLPLEVKLLIKKIMEISKLHSISLAQLSYLWLINNSSSHTSIKPIISPRNKNDLEEYISISKKQPTVFNNAFNSIDSILLGYKSYINSYPLFYLEK